MSRPVLRRTRVVVALFIPLLLSMAAARLEAIPGVGGLRILFEADSVYHHVVVAEDAQARYLRFDRSFQSGMYLHDPFDSPFLYAAYAHLGLIFRPQARRVLVVGLGGGSIPKRFWRDYPQMSVEVAELDPMVVDVARRFFDVQQQARLRIVAADGRLFLRKTPQRYDMIILDAYFAESIPFHLTTREFLQLAKSRLSPGGVVVSNIIGALEGPQSRLFRAMYRTFGVVFPGLYPFPTAFRPDDDRDTVRNILLAAINERGITHQQVLSRARGVAPRVTYPQFLKYAGDHFDGAIAVEDVPVLTDDYAPVDSLLPVYRWSLPPTPR